MWISKIFTSRSAFMYSSSIIKSSPYISRSFFRSSILCNNLSKRKNAFQSFNLHCTKFTKIIWPFRTKTAITQTNVNIMPEWKIGCWLILCAGAVYCAILIGGLTRLTESGLSMVTWRFMYENFPKSDQEWIVQFENYKQYPEFKMLKKSITLEEFKNIWIMEYLHRNWGRCIGLLFFIPATTFWIKGYLSSPLKIRLLIFGSLLISQGLLGWYMVQSGLEDRFQKETDVPRVSQYRLAAHLGLALILYSGFLWTALDLLLPAATKLQLNSSAKKLKRLIHGCKGLVFLTALSGAFVSGLDAGLVYNSFPKMGDKWIPDDVFALTPFIKNFTENPTTVQLLHRILAISTFSVIMATCAMSKKLYLPRRIHTEMNILAFAACFQVALGISTLVHYVPVSQAAAHQSGSIALLSIALWVSNELKKLKYLPK